MLFLFLLGIWGGPAGVAPPFLAAWAKNANSIQGQSVPVDIKI